MPAESLELNKAPSRGWLSETACRIAKPLNNSFWTYLGTRAFRNFHWVVQWEITRWCNLRCDYCCVDLVNELPDVNQSIETILRIKPKYLIVTGGEPLSVKNIDEIIARVKHECGDPFIVVNSNLTLAPRVFLSVLPHINILHVSLDSLGKGNGLHRDGSDGDRVLRNLELAWKEKFDKGYHKLCILVNCVVTREIVPGLRELIKTIHAIHPNITISLSGVEPHWHPMALVNYPEELAEVQAVLAEMQPEHDVRAVGYLNNPVLKGPATELPAAPSRSAPGENITVECTRQYFRALVEPDGKIKACKPERYLGYHLNRAKQFWSEHRFLAVAKEYWDAWDNLVLRPYKRHCPFPCKCEEFLDDILNPEGGPSIRHAELFNGRMTDQDVEEANHFLRNYYNHELSAAVRAQWLATQSVSTETTRK